MSLTQVTLGTFFTTPDGKTVLGGSGGSGLDTQSLIKSLTDAKGAAATQYQDQIDINDKQSAALTTFQNLLSAFQTASDALRNPPGVGNDADNAFKFTTASITSNTAVAGSTYVNVTTTPGASLQSYTISDITSLATAASQGTGTFNIASADASAVTAAATAGMFKAGTITVNGQSITLNTGDSLNLVAAKFNAVSSATGIGATVIQIDSTHYRLSFSATSTGTSHNFDLTDAATAVDTTGVLENVGLGTEGTQDTGTFTIADADQIIVSAAPIGGTANQFGPGTITINGQNITLTEGETLNQVAAAFEAVKATTGISASVVDLGGGQFKLHFTATRPGPTNDFDLTALADPDGVLTNAGLGAATPGTTTATAATDANFKINGISITRQSNSINDVVSGVTFNLLQQTPDAGTHVTVAIQPDTTTIQNSIVAFVKAYNDIKTFAAQQTQLNSDGTYASTAVLAGDSAFRTIIADITTQITSQVSGITGSNPSSLSDVGITFVNQPSNSTTPEVDNILNVNDGKLTSALQTNFTGVRNLFGFNLTSNNANLRIFSENNQLATTSFTLNIDPGTNTFTATYNPGTGPVTVNLTAQALSGTPGYTLTGQAGTALAGTTFIYASNSSAVITATATQGLADKLFNTAKASLAASTGTLAIALKTLKDSDTKLNQNIAQVNLQVAQYRNELLIKFGALEQAISKVNTLLQSLNANQNAALTSSGH